VSQNWTCDPKLNDDEAEDLAAKILEKFCITLVKKYCNQRIRYLLCKLVHTLTYFYLFLSYMNCFDVDETRILF
jgi:hypothetical protein